MKRFAYLLSLATTSSFAVSVQFNFDINSSGSSIYPCDAGIRHATHTARICYDRTTNLSCDPTTGTTTENQDCVCTGGTTGSEEYRLDNFTATHADWTDNGDTPTSIMTTNVGADESAFARLYTANNEWDKQLTSLTLNFASDLYGAEFYLDVCYRGPQIKPRGNPNYAMNLQTTLTDLISSNNLAYSQLADLKVKIDASCDLQGEGSITEIPTDDAQDNQISGVSGGDVNFTTSYAAFTSGANMVLLHDFINNGNNKAPRFCKIRYSFIENMRNNSADPMAQIRKWKNQKARISTFSDVAQKNSL